MANAYQRILRNRFFTPPEGWLRIRTIDMHTGGEPLRVIVDGFPPLRGGNVLEYRRYVRKHYDHLRRALMHEPRGHADMYGCLLLPPDDDGADFGILFLHNEGYSTMCGHATIAIAILAVQMGWVEAQEPETLVAIDAPCGRLHAFVKVEKSGPAARPHIRGAYFHGVPSFVAGLGLEVEVPELGAIRYDLAYGGAFYAYVDAGQIGLELTPANYSRIIQAGMQIKRAVAASPQPVEHPFEEDLSFLYGTIFIGGPVSEGIDSRNVCVFAEGEVDRCPTGSGLSGRLPIHYARGEIGIGETMTVESITGSVFKGSIVRRETYGPYPAVIPRVEGTAFVTGRHEFLIDPEDPFRHGFFLR